MSSWKDYKKTIGNVDVGVTGIASSATVVSLVHGQGALWLAFGVTVLQSVAHTVTTYTVPNGASVYDRVAELEKVAAPDVKNIETAITDLHAGVAAKAPWPTVGLAAPTTVAAPVEVTPAP